MDAIEARNHILSVFQDAWTELGSYKVVWDDVTNMSNTNDFWARVTMRHTLGQQASLAGNSPARLWEQTGTLTVQLFTPVGDGNTLAYQVAQKIVNAYRKAKSDCVWYRNPTINEIGTSGAFQQTNVIVDFSYTDRG